MRSPGRIAHRVVGTIALAWGVSVGSGCPSDIAADRLSATVVDSGRYELQSGRLVRTSSSVEVECALGVIFGVDYRIEVEGWGFGTMPVEFSWRHPELAVPTRKIWGEETPARAPRPFLEWGAEVLEGRALWRLDDPLELVEGRYVFLIRRLDDGSTLLSRSFVLGGC